MMSGHSTALRRRHERASPFEHLSRRIYCAHDNLRGSTDWQPHEKPLDPLTTAPLSNWWKGLDLRVTTWRRGPKQQAHFISRVWWEPFHWTAPSGSATRVAGLQHRHSSQTYSSRSRTGYAEQYHSRANDLLTVFSFWELKIGLLLKKHFVFMLRTTRR